MKRRSEMSAAGRSLPNEGLLPIRTVASLTGVNPVTLRAWERRYGLIKPVRTPKGHRLYTMDDVELIQEVLALLDSGMSIGQVGQVIRPSNEAEVQPQDRNDPWAGYQHRLIDAITRFDEAGLDETYNEALSLYPVDIVTDRLIVPLLRELGWRWERAEGNVAEEHFFSVYLRNKLGARFHHRNRVIQGPRLLAACLPGEQHELGLLLFALAAIDRDYRMILLGANTPLKELPGAVNRARCDALVLAGSLATPVQAVSQEMADVVVALSVPAFVGGKVTRLYPREIQASGAVSLGDDVNTALRRLDEVLKG
ncbi:MAG: MerR family transcriptional regulator [Candidatus Competibacteraceae bacterium]|nr:MerR family transcriptional regulator [Candidatus Competibacteraceae bacterium]